jgi:hypothetical protein
MARAAPVGGLLRFAPGEASLQGEHRRSGEEGLLDWKPGVGARWPFRPGCNGRAVGGSAVWGLGTRALGFVALVPGKRRCQGP